ncbi:MAG TPA: hypothetical protein VFV70_06650, partial [Hyphomonadaceae bacterium]|nr:hypothetical protein [Hyphomonadaceae bacterium]
MDSLLGNGDSRMLLDGALDTTTRTLVDYVQPIFVLDERGRPELLGSAVLLQVGDTGLLLTAGHVLEEQRTLYSSFGDTLRALEVGEQCRVDATKDGIGPVDFGVVRLPTRWKGLLTGGKRALVPANLAFAEPVPCEEPVAFVGFPSSRAKRRPDLGIIERKPFVWVGYSGTPEDYQAQRLLQELHVLVPYGKGLPKLNGMSGGGA